MGPRRWTQPFPSHFGKHKCKRADCKKNATTYVMGERLSRSHNLQTFNVGAYCTEHAAEVMERSR